MVVDVILEQTENSKPRLFLIVPAKLFPKATERNRIKRWCRESWRKNTLAGENDLLTTIRIKNKTVDHNSIQNDLKTVAAMYV